MDIITKTKFCWLAFCMVLHTFKYILYAEATSYQILLTFIIIQIWITNFVDFYIYLNEPIFELPPLTIKLSPCGTWAPRWETLVQSEKYPTSESCSMSWELMMHSPEYESERMIHKASAVIHKSIQMKVV